MSDRAARQRRRPPAVPPAAPVASASDGRPPTTTTAGRRSQQQRAVGRGGSRGRRNQPKSMSTVTSTRMPSPTPREMMASLTTALLDKATENHHHLELQSSSQHDVEKNLSHSQQLPSSSSSSSSSSSALLSLISWNNWKRRMHQFIAYLGTTLPFSTLAAATTTTTNPSSFSSCKKISSKRLFAFLSHFCFILASSLYVQLSFVNRSWLFVARDQYRVPSEVMDADDDISWHNWEKFTTIDSDNNNNKSDKLRKLNDNNIDINDIDIINIINNNTNTVDDDIGYDPILEHIRSKYALQSTSLQIYASLLFVMVGLFDWMRYRDTMNIFMIFAGGAGMASGMASSSSMESVWNCVSVHIYLLEAYNLSNRERSRTKKDHPHDSSCAGGGGDEGNGGGGKNVVVIGNDHRKDDEGDEKHLFLKVGNTCFLVGCILDVLGSYVDLAGAQGLWVIYADMTSNFLWLECALIELGSEIYHLHHHAASSARKWRGNINDDYTIIHDH